jgi:lysozyme family protein
MFEKSLDRVLINEGGYVNDPQDPGGETRWGISKRSYPNLDIANLTKEQAGEIYRRDFWDKCHADNLPPALAFQVFDMAVNSGIGTAIRKLQLAAGVADDGQFGPVTAGAVSKMSDQELTIGFLAERLDFMRRLTTWPRFGAGWAARIATDMRLAAKDL